MDTLLDIQGLQMSVNEKQILKNLNLNIKKGEVHVVMGPNGAGKSTLAAAIVGNPKFTIDSGKIFFEGELINEVPVHERARKGIFLSFQIPEEIPGLKIEEFLRASKEAVSGKKISIFKFHSLLLEKMKDLHINEEYAGRSLNVGFSGGEKKKNEILQLAILEPKLAILDETDSGLDIDATKIVFEGVSKIRTDDMGILIITHHNKVLDYIKPDFVHILIDGTIVKTGDMALVEYIEKHGYANIQENI
ncbi:Fe-S cluster assembly ATPase SufC [Treponema phagedenis]|uniref:Component of SufBCD complex, ATP-binding component of ABC superfamily n=1 Tax=Treponema phagedenis TaxID=162 RepID=A0A0B7GTI4_TREPH|nr:Fe-S cluster assembly ATPase SufC [Treponema phagedenis]EFW36979.1 FeS assembly ATPase SufC [Treponema phagedenis F0421]QEJ96347.1 Fe-S cluster assembly ATPase SufC [Treponema phagedenis]QEJ99506.1 Fe-S cluster assembly ATPase SufC [Treponema phagedenis]QEK02145.1 Fe-S cluster assembly ATPase SufC [Treponema phagedenis]QEK05077.1 Fe-S cluster assembly ATPase SufC [Treponema phagedenis]